MALQKKMIFPTRFNQNRPFILGGRSFFSKRLNGEEEIEVQRVQLLGQIEKDAATTRSELVFIAEVLAFRATGSEPVTVEWLQDHLCKVQGIKLLSYLRTGEGLAPGETFDIPTFEGFEIEDRVFSAPAMTYREALHVQDSAAQLESGEVAEAGRELVDGAKRAQATADAGEEDENFEDVVREMVERGLKVHARARELTRGLADIVADLLNARLISGEPITGQWLMQTVTENFITQILLFLTSGEYEDGTGTGEGEGEGQGDNPNAEPAPVIA